MGNHKKTSPPNVKKCKQSLGDSYESSDSEQDTQQPTSSTLLNVPRFLVVKSQEENRTMADLSHFVIEKCIQSIVHVGHPKTIKKLKSGDLLLEVDRKQQVENLLKPTRYLTSKSNYYYTILSDLPRVSFPARSYVLAAKRTSLKIWKNKVWLGYVMSAFVETVYSNQQTHTVLHSIHRYCRKKSMLLFFPWM